MDELTTRITALEARVEQLAATLEDLELAVGEQLEHLETWNERRRQEILQTNRDVHDARDALLVEIASARSELTASRRRSW